MQLRELLPKVSPSSLRYFRPFSSVIGRKFLAEQENIHSSAESFRLLQPSWLGAIFAVEEISFTAFTERSEIIRIQLNNAHNDSLNLIYCPTVMLSNFPYSLLKSLPSDLHPHWKSYIAIINFSENPSKESLAQTLQAFSENYEPEFIKWLKLRSPWQISACLASSSSSSELLEIVAKAERGELGDIDEWLKAEDRWSNNGLTESDFLCADSVTLPFNHEIGKCGFPFSASTLRYLNHSSLDGLDFLHELVRLHSCLVKDKIRHFISRSILNLLRECSTKKIGMQEILAFEKFEEVINDLVNAKHYFTLDQLDFIFTVYDESKGIKLMDLIGRKSNLLIRNYYSRELLTRFKPIIKSFATQFSSNPELIGVLRLISFIELEHVNLQAVILAIPKNLLEMTQFSDSADKESAAIISLVRGDISLDDINFLADLAAASTDKCSRISLKLLSLIREGKFSLANAEKLLMELRHRLPQADYDCSGKMLEAANELLTTRTSNLGNAEVWSKLGLPAGLGQLVLKSSDKQSHLWIS